MLGLSLRCKLRLVLKLSIITRVACRANDWGCCCYRGVPPHGLHGHRGGRRPGERESRRGLLHAGPVDAETRRLLRRQRQSDGRAGSRGRRRHHYSLPAQTPRSGQQANTVRVSVKAQFGSFMRETSKILYNAKQWQNVLVFVRFSNRK